MKERLHSCRIGGKQQEGLQLYYFSVDVIPFSHARASGMLSKSSYTQNHTHSHKQTHITSTGSHGLQQYSNQVVTQEERRLDQKPRTSRDAPPCIIMYKSLFTVTCGSEGVFQMLFTSVWRNTTVTRTHANLTFESQNTAKYQYTLGVTEYLYQSHGLLAIYKNPDPGLSIAVYPGLGLENSNCNTFINYQSKRSESHHVARLLGNTSNVFILTHVPRVPRTYVQPTIIEITTRLGVRYDGCKVFYC